MNYDELLKTALEEYGLAGVHPAANIFPMMSDEEFEGLVKDVGENGFGSSVIVDNDYFLIDGRNRLCASVLSRKDVHIKRMDIIDPIAYVASHNLHRRQLTTGQKAMAALRIEEMYAEEAKERQRQSGGDRKSERYQESVPVNLPEPINSPKKEKATPKPKDLESREKAARAVGISGKTISKAKAVAKSNPKLAEDVKQGKTSLEKAYKQTQKEVNQAARQAEAEVEAEFGKIPAIDPDIIMLPDHKGVEYAYPKPKGKSQFNAQKGSEIGWAMYSWNPVTGCNHGCSYCYARAIAESDDMEKFYPAGFTPLFHHERLEAPANTPIPEKAKTDPAWGRVFVCSMADLFGSWVPQEWIDSVVNATLKSPQWEYLFLTKYPQRYHRLNLPKSGWIGASIDNQKAVEPTLKAMSKITDVKVKWLSLEPLLEPLQFSSLKGIDWIVIGAQSANYPQNPEFAPDFEWVMNIVSVARRDGCKIWLKTNLLGVTNPQFPGMKLINEIPFEVSTIQEDLF